MKTFSNKYLVLLFALSTFGCSTAVVNMDDEDAQSVAVDAGNGGTDVLSKNADAAVQQNADNKAVNVADVQSADTTKSADVAQKADAADTFGAKPDVHHDADAIDAGADVKSTADAGSSNVDTQVNGTDASNGTDSVDAGADTCVLKGFCLDADGDGFGNGSKCVYTCTAPQGYVPDSNDCNDSNPNQTTAYLEVCDGKDNDCDGMTDEDVNPNLMQTYYEDKDKDSFGNPNKSKKACSKPVGHVVTGTDCDDNDNMTWPGTFEQCDGKDNNCNGVIDDGVQLITYYVDEDNDGYGSNKNPTFPSTTQCSNIPGIPSYYVPNKDDCNNKDASINPGALEVCGDSIDNNCDSETDEGCEEGGCGPMEDVCDPVTCATLGGTCDEFGACNSFCDSCATYSACEDMNQDGLGDKCTSIPSNMIAPYYKGLDNAIVVVLPNVSLITDFDFGFQTYKKISEKGMKWTDYTQWQLDSNFFVMNFLINGDIKTSPNVGFNDPEVCGIRFNANIDTTGKTQLNPSNHWLCEGNGTTAHWYDPATRFFHVKEMVLIEVTKHVQKWSAPGGPTDGCSALLPIKSTCPQ